MVGFYAPNSGWLSSWGLGIGLLEESGNLSLVVPWSDISRLFGVVARLPFCPTSPILTFSQLSSRIFIVLHFTFSSMLYFRINFREACKHVCVYTHFFVCDIHLFWHHLLKRSAGILGFVFFLVNSFRFSTEKTLSSANKVSFISSFPISIPFISFSCLNVSARSH